MTPGVVDHSLKHMFRTQFLLPVVLLSMGLGAVAPASAQLSPKLAVNAITTRPFK